MKKDRNPYCKLSLHFRGICLNEIAVLRLVAGHNAVVQTEHVITEETRREEIGINCDRRSDCTTYHRTTQH